MAAWRWCRQTGQRDDGSTAAAAAAASLAGWLELLTYKQDLQKVHFEVLHSFLNEHYTYQFPNGLPAKVTVEQESRFLFKTNAKNRNPKDSCRNMQRRLVESKRCHYIMFKAAILFKLLTAFILYIYTVFEHIDMLSIGIWEQPYSIISTLLGSDLGILGHLWSQNDVIVSWLRPSFNSNCCLHPY
jgi:hypothetical protein